MLVTPISPGTLIGPSTLSLVPIPAVRHTTSQQAVGPQKIWLQAEGVAEMTINQRSSVSRCCSQSHQAGRRCYRQSRTQSCPGAERMYVCRQQSQISRQQCLSPARGSWYNRLPLDFLAVCHSCCPMPPQNRLPEELSYNTPQQRWPPRLQGLKRSWWGVVEL